MKERKGRRFGETDSLALVGGATGELGIATTPVPTGSDSRIYTVGWGNRSANAVLVLFLCVFYVQCSTLQISESRPSMEKVMLSHLHSFSFTFTASSKTR